MPAHRPPEGVLVQLLVLLPLPAVNIVHHILRLPHHRLGQGQIFPGQVRQGLNLPPALPIPGRVGLIPLIFLPGRRLHLGRHILHLHLHLAVNLLQLRLERIGLLPVVGHRARHLLQHLDQRPSRLQEAGAIPGRQLSEAGGAKLLLLLLKAVDPLHRPLQLERLPGAGPVEPGGLLHGRGLPQAVQHVPRLRLGEIQRPDPVFHIIHHLLLEMRPSVRRDGDRLLHQEFLRLRRVPARRLQISVEVPLKFLRKLLLPAKFPQENPVSLPESPVVSGHHRIQGGVGGNPQIAPGPGGPGRFHQRPQQGRDAQEDHAQKYGDLAAFFHQYTSFDCLLISLNTFSSRSLICFLKMITRPIRTTIIYTLSPESLIK